MDTLSPKQIREKRAQANPLKPTVHVGKGGVDESVVSELQAQLKKNKLVKVRLLPTATEGGEEDRDQAEALAEATGSVLVETRGHTAVYWRG